MAALLEVFEFLQLSLVYDVPVEILETLLDSLLHHCLCVELRRCDSFTIAYFGVCTSCKTSYRCIHQVGSLTRGWSTAMHVLRFRVNEVLEHVRSVLALDL